MFITSKIDEASIIQALLAGVDGYVSERMNEEVLIQAIRNIYNDHVILSKESASVLNNYISATRETKETILYLEELGIHIDLINLP